MKKNIPYVKIDKFKNKEYQFYYNDMPIHPDKLFPQLKTINPHMIFIQVFKNEKMFWEAYYPLSEQSDIEKVIWKAFHFRM